MFGGTPPQSPQSPNAPRLNRDGKPRKRRAMRPLGTSDYLTAHCIDCGQEDLYAAADIQARKQRCLRCGGTWRCEVCRNRYRPRPLPICPPRGTKPPFPKPAPLTDPYPRLADIFDASFLGNNLMTLTAPAGIGLSLNKPPVLCRCPFCATMAERAPPTERQIRAMRRGKLGIGFGLSLRTSVKDFTRPERPVPDTKGVCELTGTVRAYFRTLPLSKVAEFYRPDPRPTPCKFCGEMFTPSEGKCTAKLFRCDPCDEYERERKNSRSRARKRELLAGRPLERQRKRPKKLAVDLYASREGAYP